MSQRSIKHKLTNLRFLCDQVVLISRLCVEQSCLQVPMLNSVHAKSGFSKWLTPSGEGVYFGTARPDECAITRE